MISDKLRCPKRRILFQFVESTRGGSFNNNTDWGFEIKKPTEDVKAPRWAEAKVIGKDVTTVKTGQYIFIEPMMWTLSFEFEGEKYWATAEDKVIGISDIRPTGLV
jgi:hypothetical protein